MTLQECIDHIPPLDQEDVHYALADVHTCLLNKGATNQGGQRGQITYWYLRNCIIVTDTVATGRSDRYVISFNRSGYQGVRIIQGRHRQEVIPNDAHSS